MIWKIYFWFLIAIIMLAILVGFLTTPGLFTNIFDIFNMLFMLIGLIGVYGFAYKKRVGPKSLWLTILIITLLYQILYSFVFDPRYGASPALSIADQLVTFVPLIPMFIALGLYSLSKK